MSKSVLISIQPYWVFLIISKKMGWNIGKEKTVEIRKNYPKAETWDKTTKIYCSRDKKSFARIPKEYQPLMERLLGKVIGEFVCKHITNIEVLNYGLFTGGYPNGHCTMVVDNSALTVKEIKEYANGKKWVYGWHISDLKIYDKPKELSEFKQCHKCEYYADCYEHEYSCDGVYNLTRPPQSWCYVEEV